MRMMRRLVWLNEFYENDTCCARIVERIEPGRLPYESGDCTDVTIVATGPHNIFR